MSVDLKGKAALVTGASRGIGRAIAMELARCGALVAINYANSSAEAQKAVEEIMAFGGEAIAVQGDVAQVADLERIFDETIARFGKLDILVNNAGIMFIKPITQTAEDEFDRIIGVNLKGTYFACKLAATWLADGGRIINFSSSVTARFMPSYSAYGATKGAVEQITRSLAKELGPRGITINTVSPGPTETELFLAGKTEAELEFYGKQSAFGRLGRPAEIADVVAFLASDGAAWISGQNIRVNGGLA